MYNLLDLFNRKYAERKKRLERLHDFIHSDIGKQFLADISVELDYHDSHQTLLKGIDDPQLTGASTELFARNAARMMGRRDFMRIVADCGKMSYSEIEYFLTARALKEYKDIHMNRESFIKENSAS